MIRRLYRRLRYGVPIVIVSGLPRSGTSMAMKMLEAGGMAVVTDGERLADEDNPKGYFEDERIKDLESEVDKTWIRAARGRALKVISFLLKDLPAENNYRVLFMRRDLDEVLASQRKMLERRGEEHDAEDHAMQDAYENHLWRVFYQLKRRPEFDWIEVDYTKVLDTPQVEARRIADFLELPLDVGAMSAVVDQSLYRNRGEALKSAP